MDLIICPGHGVCVVPESSERHDAWVGIFAYSEEGSLLTQHCATAVAMAAANRASRLVFSGGDTRRLARQLSEAESYHRIAKAARWWSVPDVESRTLLECHARCSRDNLVYSLACFYSELRALPDRLVVVGWGFKDERFRMHADAISWPGEFCYVGINNPPRGGPLEMALAGEARKREAMRVDPLLLGAEWQEQRRLRNPFNTEQSYSQSAPSFAPFLDYLKGVGSPVLPPWEKGAMQS